MEIERRKKGKTQDSLNDRTRDSRPPTPVNNNSVDVLDSPPDDNSARHLFKIIDYGLANFEETFAAGPDVVLEVGKLIQPSFLLIRLRVCHVFSSLQQCAVLPRTPGCGLQQGSICCRIQYAVLG